MGLQVTQQPSVEPVSEADAKLWCRIDHTVEDSIVDSLITTARREVEKFLRRPIMLTQYLWTFDGFPGYVLPTMRDPAFFNVVRESQDLILRFPIGGVGSLADTDAVQYRDLDTQDFVTLDPSMYVTDFTEQPGRIAPAYQQVWPQVLPQIGSVKIAFSAGYTGEPTQVSETIKTALKLVMCDMWNNRGDSNLQFDSYTVPHSAEMLLSDERVYAILKG